MKKLFKFAMIILAVILLLGAATSIIAPLIDNNNITTKPSQDFTDEVSFIEMYAGNNILNEGVITVDGYLDDAYVLVSPSTGVTKCLSKMYYAGISEAAALADSQEDLSKTSDISYYIAQTNDKIYLLIKEVGGRWGDGDIDFIARHNYYLRLGLDPTDYSKAAVINIGVGSSVNEDLKVVRISDSVNSVSPTVDFITNSSMIKYRIDSNGDLIQPGIRGNNNTSSSYYGFVEIEIDKALAAEAFELDEFPTEMFIGLSAQAYSWTDSSKKNVSSIFYTWYGSMLTDEEKITYNASTALIPDKIVLADN